MDQVLRSGCLQQISDCGPNSADRLTESMRDCNVGQAYGLNFNDNLYSRHFQKVYCFELNYCLSAIVDFNPCTHSIFVMMVVSRGASRKRGNVSVVFTLGVKLPERHWYRFR